MALNLRADRDLKFLARKSGYEVSLFASYLGLSERTLERYFQGEKEMTPSEWTKQLRIADASALLGEGMKVEAVAKAVHYKNHSHFTRAFRRGTGQTPTEFQRSAISRKSVG